MDGSCVQIGEAVMVTVHAPAILVEVEDELVADEVVVALGAVGDPPLHPVASSAPTRIVATFGAVLVISTGVSLGLKPVSLPIAQTAPGLDHARLDVTIAPGSTKAARAPGSSAWQGDRETESTLEAHSHLRRVFFRFLTSQSSLRQDPGQDVRRPNPGLTLA